MANSLFNGVVSGDYSVGANHTPPVPADDGGTLTLDGGDLLTNLISSNQLAAGTLHINATGAYDETYEVGTLSGGCDIGTLTVDNAAASWNWDADVSIEPSAWVITAGSVRMQGATGGSDVTLNGANAVFATNGMGAVALSGTWADGGGWRKHLRRQW